MYQKGSIKKIKVSFKFYDVTVWLTKVLIYILPDISRCLILFLMYTCNSFPLLAFVTMIYWTSTEVLLNLVAPLDSAVPPLDFKQFNVLLNFWF